MYEDTIGVKTLVYQNQLPFLKTVTIVMVTSQSAVIEKYN